MRYIFGLFFLIAAVFSSLRLFGVVETPWRTIALIALTPIALTFLLFVMGVLIHHRRRENRQKRHQQ